MHVDSLTLLVTLFNLILRGEPTKFEFPEYHKLYRHIWLIINTFYQENIKLQAKAHLKTHRKQVFERLTTQAEGAGRACQLVLSKSDQGAIFTLRPDA